MVSINTNLSSLIVQNNLTKSTNALNTAIERMTTGFKINSASDNAANYSISQNMVTQLSAYDVATDNIAMGIDMVNTAQDSIALMQQHGQRIHDLITQAQNGTYGEESLRAINAEVQSRIQEIDRIYANTEYNGINILNGIELPDWAEGVNQHNGFIEEAHHIEDSEVNALTHVADIDSFTDGETYAVSTVEDLVTLAELINGGESGDGSYFVMGADIDISQWCAENMNSNSYGGWEPIGMIIPISDNGYIVQEFYGIFDGNGHKISGIKINRTNNNGNFSGVFGNVCGTIKNLGVEDVDITGSSHSGGIVAYAKDGGNINNCYVTGNISGNIDIGGLVGTASNCIIENSYANVSVTGVKNTGGLIGKAILYEGNSITNSYATGSVSGSDWIGGLIGALNTNATVNLDKIFSTTMVTSSTKNQTGNLIGGIVNTTNGSSFKMVNITNASALSQGLDMIGFEGKSDGTAYVSGQMESWLSNITEFTSPTTTLQVGIYGNDSSSITFDTSVSYNLSAITARGAQDKGAFDVINKFISDISERATQLGAVSNRLESALDSTTVSIENLTSSLSTIRDADIATESSNYIKQQILQQASATLLATANQSPSIALQLI